MCAYMIYIVLRFILMFLVITDFIYSIHIIITIENISDITVLDHQYYRFGRVMLSHVDGFIYKSHMYNNPQLWYMLNGSRHALSNTAVLDHLNLTYHHKIHIVDDYDLDFIPIGNPLK